MSFFNVPQEHVQMTTEDAKSQYQKMVQYVGEENKGAIASLETMRRQIASQQANEFVEYNIPKRQQENIQKAVASNLVESDQLNMQNMDAELQKVISVEGMYHNRYVSPEGGTDTVGIGHKMSPEEHAGNFVWIDGAKVPLDNDLSDDMVIKLWEQDDLKAVNRTNTQLTSRGIDPKSLTDEMFHVAKNLAYNMGTIPSNITNALKEGDKEGFNENLLRSIGMKGNTTLSAGLARNRAKSYNMVNDDKIINFEFNKTEDGKTVYSYYNIHGEVVQQYETDKPLDGSNRYNKRYGM